jgi:hypothetical protein
MQISCTKRSSEKTACFAQFSGEEFTFGRIPEANTLRSRVTTKNYVAGEPFEMSPVKNF